MKNYVIKLSVFKDEKYFFISIYYYKPMICKFFVSSVEITVWNLKSSPLEKTQDFLHLLY